MSADELLAAYAGKEEVLLSHLRKMKERQTEDAAYCAAAVAPNGSGLAIAAAVANTPADETEKAPSANGSAVKNKQSPQKRVSFEDEVCSNDNEPDKVEVFEDEVCSNDNEPDEVEMVPQQFTDELLAFHAARENVSLSDPVTATEAGTALSSGSDIAATTESSDDFAMKSSDDFAVKHEQTREEVMALVNEVCSNWSHDDGVGGKDMIPPESADELLSSYAGREDALLSKLTKVKDKSPPQTNHKHLEQE
jgi:hypothetical protein